MPSFKSLNRDLLFPQEGVCHKVRKVSRPEDWDDLPYFETREDRADHPTHLEPQDTVYVHRLQEGKTGFSQVKGLRG